MPTLITATAQVHECYDEVTEQFRITVNVTNRRFGPVFGYSGAFSVRYAGVAGAGVPATVKPRREQLRC